MAIRRIIIIAIAVLCCAVSHAAAQNAAIPSRITVSLLTCAPGSEIYQLEGHTALRFKSNDFDLAANWGLFDFNAPNFVYRFVNGETDYMVALYPTEVFLEEYRQEKRRVSEQVLALDSVQAARLFAEVLEAAEPQNRVYRYKYVSDNCATRPLRYITEQTGPLDLRDPHLGIEIPSTFRNVMRHYHSNYPWYQFGIDIALGIGVDYHITKKDMVFAPHALRRILARTRTTAQGNKKLVTAENILVPGDENGVPCKATPWFLTPMTMAVIVLGFAIWASVADLRRRKLYPWFDTVFYTLLGVAGCIVAYLVFVSSHEATSPNYNLLWLNPLLLLIPALTFTRFRDWLSYLQAFNLALIVTYCFVIISGVQSYNIAFLPLLAADVLRAVVRIYIFRYENHI